ncbi:hypothetical protein JI435_401100 [Parastagonospora nodorum SN15]|uniref:Uncharacterized protein n=1 Tax=Phaeosphaeria nodorum (strain SN15 / ATCC MYA-4574 / FGSC 10173) TaxID=321614 RepID=A0A7U2EQJ8_PHANO|nr:hypothetical protein JI435_401100 [Parastagonospora nodorum SN15]
MSQLCLCDLASLVRALYETNSTQGTPHAFCGEQDSEHEHMES